LLKVIYSIKSHGLLVSLDSTPYGAYICDLSPGHLPGAFSLLTQRDT